MIVLVPGRFQPFHRGHFGNIRKMVDKGYSVKVAIRDMKINKKNPWPATMIKQIIKKTLMVEGLKNIQVFVVPDLCENWEKVVKKVVGDFDTVAAGNPRLKTPFKGLEYRIIHTPRKDNPWSATQVRRQLEKGESVENMCLPSTIKVMQDLRMLPKVNTFWLIGRSSAGKTTLARQVAVQLNIRLLDGDDVRKFVDNQDFSKEGRERHLMYVSLLSQTLNECGIPTLCAFITPLKKVQKLLYKKIQNFHLIYIKCSLEEARRRDIKGLYSKNTSGIDMFEEPEICDLVVDTDNESVDESAAKIVAYIDKFYCKS